jgi:hypothetical protein
MFNHYNPIHLFLASQSQEFKNRIYYKPLLKESRGPGNTSLASFSYNGLIYTLNPELNMFVNQFGHAMDYAQAVALASSVGYTDQDFEDLADVSDYDGGSNRSAAIVAATNAFIYAHGKSPYGWPKGATTWPTAYDDTKGLTYFYPYLFFWPDFMGPDPVKAAAGTLTQLDGFGFTSYQARGTLQATPEQTNQGGLQYQWDFDAGGGYFQQSQVPTSGSSNFTFGATGHALTAYVDAFIDGFSWIPADKRLFFAQKPYSFANAVSGVTGIECRLSRFNYLTRGNSFTYWTWTSGATFLSAGHTAPSGVTTGTLSASLVSFPGSAAPQLSRTVTLPDGGRTYTFSVFLQGLTANEQLELDFSGGPGSGIVTLGTGWTRFQLQKFANAAGPITAILGGNDGTPGITWASQFRIWGAQVELGENVSTASNSHLYYLDTSSGNVASEVVQNESRQRSMWLARKGAWAEREVRNFLTALKDRGFTMGRLSIDDESYNQMSPFLYDRKTTGYIWEYNTLKINESSGGNTWWASFTGISAQPRCLFAKTNNRFGLPGVTNFRDLLLLRGFTTNSAVGGFIDGLKFDQSNSKHSVGFADSRSSSTNLFSATVKEMNSAFIEDAIVTPFKEIMIGDTGNTTAVIYNYGYVDSFAAFVGNTYLTPSGGATTASMTGASANLRIPNYNELWPLTQNTSIESPQALQWLSFKDDVGYSRHQLGYFKGGNQSCYSLYGTMMQASDGYGYYLTDNLMNPRGGFGSSTHATLIGARWSARNIFDFNRVVVGNSYGYSGAAWANVPKVGYIQAGIVGSNWPGVSTNRLVHIPGFWRGLTVNGGSGFTLGPNSFNTSSLLANYRGICGASGWGRACVGCNDQTSFVLDYFFNEMWGLTQSSQVRDDFCGVNILPISVRAAVNGLTQGSITAQWLRGLTGSTTLSDGTNIADCYFDEAYRPIPGITFVPGTIYRDYDTHWYPLGWMAFMTDLGASRESARSRVYEALEKRSRTGNSSIPQDPYVIFVHTPTYGAGNYLNYEQNGYRISDPEYVHHAFGGFYYLRPLGITYDVVRVPFTEGIGSAEIRGMTMFYGDINHYWSENIRHSYLHKLIAVEQWGGADTMQTVNPGRSTVTLDLGQGGWHKSYWRSGSNPVVTNANEIRTMLGNNSLFRVGNLEVGFSGFCGFTMGGVEPNRAYKGGYRINAVIADCNTRGNGMVHETMYLAPINWAEKSYTISGAQLIDSSYLWRITFLHKATETINVRGSQTGTVTSYNIAGVTNFIDNGNHERGIWWTSNVYELPVVINPPVNLNPGLPAGTTTWNGISGAGSSTLFPLGIQNNDILF